MQTPLLSVRGVKVQFGGIVALHVEQFDLADVDGIAAVFIGPNGAGKTTLLNVITGYVPVQRPGKVIFGTRIKKDLGGLAPAAVVRAGVARTFQSPCLFQSLTVREVLGLALRFAGSSNDSRPSTALRHDIVNAVASKCRLRTEQRTAELTLADARRLDLARALMSAPRLLMLDEPTAGLSQPEKNELLAFLAKDVRAIVGEISRDSNRSGIAFGLITHDMAFLYALQEAGLLSKSTVTFMTLGRIAAQGDLDSITRTAIVREAYLGG